MVSPIGVVVLTPWQLRNSENVDADGNAAAASFGVASPPTISTTGSLLGNLNADGTEGPATGIVFPNGINGSANGTDDGLISVVCGLVPTPTAAAGTYIVARFTTNVPLNFVAGIDIISAASSVNTIVGGAPGARVDMPGLFLIPEPTMGFALTGLGLLGLRRRK